MMLRHNIDRLGWASSASNKNGSLAPLLTLHALVGATICGAQTAAAEVKKAKRRKMQKRGYCWNKKHYIMNMPD